MPRNRRTTRVKPRRNLCRSWDAFEKKFRPIDGPDGALYWRYDQLPENVDVHRVWTIVDCDGTLYVAAGFHIVNRIDYVVCEVPWTADEELHDYRYD